MRKVTLIVHQNYIEDVIQRLHETGLMEIIDIAKEDPETSEYAKNASMHPDASVCTTYELRLSRIIDILNSIQKKPGGFKAILRPQLPEVKHVDEETLDELCSYAEGVLDEIEKHIIKGEQQLKELSEKREDIKNVIQQVEYLKDFEMDLSYLGETDYLIVKAGKTIDLQGLKKAIDQIENVTIFSKQFGTGKNVEWAVVVVAHISEKDKIDKISRGGIIEFNLDNLSGTPNEILEQLKQDKKEIGKERGKIVAQLRKYAKDHLPDLLALREEIQLEQMRKEVTKNFAKTNTTYVIKGWALEKNENKLKASVDDVAKNHVVCNLETPSANPDNPPTYIETPKWASSFRTLLELFSTPKYNEINPTIIMGIFFVLFFGVMLGDAGYGLIILSLSLFGYIKFSKFSGFIRGWAFLGIWLGLTTTIVGFLTNGFFGDLIPRFFYNNPDQPLYSLTIGGVHLPIEPLRDPLTILTIALLFGLIHLNIGIILAIYQSYKNRDFKELFANHSSWLLLELGGGLLLGDSLLHLVSLGTVEFYFALILVIIGLVLRIWHAGPLGFFDITGFVGDWLSYARLLALGLATAGMALAFNIIAKLFADMIPIQIIGVIVMVILLVLMHAINLGLQALGAGVHSLRLQYVEFFNRFYEGGGHEFKPFSIKRKYTKTKE